MHPLRLSSKAQSVNFRVSILTPILGSPGFTSPIRFDLFIRRRFRGRHYCHNGRADEMASSRSCELSNSRHRLSLIPIHANWLESVFFLRRWKLVFVLQAKKQIVGVVGQASD